MSNRDLAAAITRSSRRAMTAQEKEAQRRSFAYGNTRLENGAITRETINRAAEALKSNADPR